MEVMVEGIRNAKQSGRLNWSAWGLMPLHASWLSGRLSKSSSAVLGGCRGHTTLTASCAQDSRGRVVRAGACLDTESLSGFQECTSGTLSAPTSRLPRFPDQALFVAENRHTPRPSLAGG